MRTRLAPLVTSCLLALTSTAHAAPRSRGPANAHADARSRSTQTLPRTAMHRLRGLPVAPSPELHALVLSMLRRFADGSVRPSAFERGVHARMGTKNAKAAARRILDRIDALPRGKRDAAFGAHSTTKEPNRATLQHAVANAGLAFAGIGLVADTVIPAEGQQPPANLELRATGIRVHQPNDADADGDELVAMATVASIANSNYASLWVQTASATPNGLVAGELRGLDLAAYSGPNDAALLTTAVFEADGNADAAREEYLLMVGLATGLAEKLVGNGVQAKLDNFMFALDYTVSLLRVSNPALWSAGALQKSWLQGNTGLAQLYLTPAQHDDSVAWKLQHAHALPTGSYQLYFDVPAPAFSLRNLKVKWHRAESSTGAALGGNAELITIINDAMVSRALPAHGPVSASQWTVQRQVDENSPSGLANVALAVAWRDTDGVLSSWADIDPAEAAWVSGVGIVDNIMLELQVDYATGQISGDVVGKLGDTFTVMGDESANARVKLSITME